MGEHPGYRLLISAEPFDPSAAVGAGPLPGPSLAAATTSSATIVQFVAPLTIPDMVRLRTSYAGLALDRYVPNLAYFERLPANLVDALRGDFLVRACLPLDPALKIASWLDRQAAGPLDLMVVLVDDVDLGAVESALGAVGARDVRSFDARPTEASPRAWCTVDDPAGLVQIASMAEVVWVEPALVAKNFDVPSAEVIQSGTVGAAGAPIWDKGLHGEGQIIGIIDQGTPNIVHSFFFDPAHPAPGPAHRKIVAKFRVLDPADSAHFTFVAGIAAGDSFAQSGTHPDRGGAWAARLVCANYYDVGRLGTLGQMLAMAADKGANVHNLSWGDSFLTGKVSTVYNLTCRDVDKFSWDHEDNLVVCAGANTGEADNSPPGIAKNSLCVACAEAHPNHMTRGSGISGPTNPDKRRKPDLMAVGCDVGSALLKPNDMFATGPLTTAARCGTSWAAPNASAAAALVRQYFTEGWYPNGKKEPTYAFTPTGALIKAVLLNSTVDMTGHSGYPSPAEGWGLIRLDRALSFDGGPRQLAVNDFHHEYGLASGEASSRFVLVRGPEEKLKITLVWMDPAAEPYSTSPAVNTLLLTVRDPAGITYQGNDMNVTTGVSRPNGAGPANTVNNVQMVVVDNPLAGFWRIGVRATVRAGDRQGFAVAVSGSLVTRSLLP